MAASAQDKRFTLTAPGALDDNGFLQYLLPRFSLKTQVRIARAPQGDLAIVTEPPGTPVFTDGTTTWRLRGDTRGEDEGRFLDWLTSEVGQETIESFPPGGTPVYSAHFETEAAAEDPLPEGDVDLGEELSLSLCGRCHVVNDRNRMSGVGSTPSFPVLRTFPDWEGKFLAFYALNPHPAFTQVDEVTDPFHESRPPTTVPLEITLDQIDAIVAYVARMAPAELGAPIESR